MVKIGENCHLYFDLFLFRAQLKIGCLLDSSHILFIPYNQFCSQKLFCNFLVAYSQSKWCQLKTRFGTTCLKTVYHFKISWCQCYSLAINTFLNLAFMILPFLNAILLLLFFLVLFFWSWSTKRNTWVVVPIRMLFSFSYIQNRIHGSCKMILYVWVCHYTEKLLCLGSVAGFLNFHIFPV